MLTLIDIPEDVLRELYEYIPYKHRCIFNKVEFIRYKYSIFPINQAVYFKPDMIYIRKIIRNNFNFIFQQLLEVYFDQLIKIKKYYCNNKVFRNLIEYINYYCLENNAYKCKDVIDYYFVEKGLSKNRHKKINYKNIRI